MHRSSPGTGVTALSLLLLAAGPVGAQDLTPVEVARMGKAATVIVQNPSARPSRFNRGGFPGDGGFGGRGGFNRGGFNRGGSRPTFYPSTTAAGFCIHPAGLFLTSYRAVSGAGDTVRVICRPGLARQQEVEARFLRTDLNADLALVWAPGVGDVPALALGTRKDVRERAEVITCGFPVRSGGRGGPPGRLGARDGPPTALLIKRSRVLSPPVEKKGEAEMFRVRADPEAGGVVLDGKGKVVGLITGVREPGEALSVTRLREFLRDPVLLLSVPPVKSADAHKPASFRARLIHPLGDPARAGAPLEIELVLKAGDRAERRLKMTGKAGVYAAMAVLVPAPARKPKFRVAITYADGAVEGLAGEQEVQILGKSYPLGSLVALQRLGEKMLVVFTDGKIVECDTADLPPLAGEVGGASWRLGLREARSVRIRPPEKVSAVTCTAIARRGETVVARQAHTIALASPEESDSKGRQTVAELDRVVRSAEVLFERYAGGKKEIVLDEVLPSVRVALANFARRQGITNGRLTRGQFVQYLMEEERTRRERFPPSRGGFRGPSRFGDPRGEGFPGRSSGGRRGRGGSGGRIP